MLHALQGNYVPLYTVVSGINKRSVTKVTDSDTTAYLFL
jgi:hypothetical protein